MAPWSIGLSQRFWLEFISSVIMKIYTKTGDSGATGLPGKKRASKSELIFDVLGDLDEFNAVLGKCRSFLAKNNQLAKIDVILKRLQDDFFYIGAIIANNELMSKKVFDTGRIEKLIDTHEAQLTPLKNFILPGGTAVAAELHFSRAVCRRLERSLVRLMERKNLDGAIVAYVNRISDLLFVLARYVNKIEKKKEEKWTL